MKCNWEKLFINDCCKIEKKLIKPKSGEKYICYSLPAFDNSKTPELLDGEEIKSSKFILSENTILFNKLNPKFRRVWNVHSLETTENTICSTEFLPLKVNETIEQDFLYYYISSPYFTKLMNRIRTGTSNSQQRIDWRSFLQESIMVPSINIQKKIALFFKNIDDKIELNNKINNNLEEQANALFRKLISNSKEYKTVTLGNVTKNIRDRVGEDNVTVLSAVNTGKLQPSDTFFTKRVYSKDTSKYITVKEGSFAYNPARINIGSIGINDLGITGCVSPVYVVFDVDNDYRSFFEFYFKTAKFKAETMLRASGSVRQSLNYNDFALIDIKYPDRGTAQFFNKFWIKQKSIISHLNRENEQLTELRDTLLPKLMSGEIDISKITI